MYFYYHSYFLIIYNYINMIIIWIDKRSCRFCVIWIRPKVNFFMSNEATWLQMQPNCTHQCISFIETEISLCGKGWVVQSVMLQFACSFTCEKIPKAGTRNNSSTIYDMRHQAMCHQGYAFISMHCMRENTPTHLKGKSDVHRG